MGSLGLSKSGRTSMTFRHAIAGFATTAMLMLSQASARAGDSDPDQLFNDAMALMEHEQFAEALPKLIEAQRVDPGIGTQFNIAVCYEKMGKLGSAWRNYSEVMKLARASGKKQREDAAREKLALLEKRAPALTITSPKNKGTDLTVRVDDAVLSEEEWAFYPIDPGEHRIAATAPAKKPWSSTIRTPSEGQRASIEVPLLETAIDTKLVTVTKETTNTKRTVGFIAGGLGLAGFVSAGITGAMLLDAHSTAKEDCTLDVPEDPSRKRCRTDAGRDAVNRADTLLPLNAVAWGVGIAGVGIGAFLILTSKRSSDTNANPKSAAMIVPSIGPSSGGIAWTQSF